MSQEDMASKNIEKANKFYEIGMKNIKLQMKLLGTNFVVLRPKGNNKKKTVFGGTYSSDSTLENDYEQFTTRLIINMNEFKDVWNRNRDTVESYTPDGTLNVGDELADLVGPLGQPTHIKKYGTVVCLAGGYGAAPCYLIAKAFKEAGNKVYMIMGARTKDLIFWEDKMKDACTELFITTDDGTLGEKGFVTQVLERIICRSFCFIQIQLSIIWHNIKFSHNI